MELALLTIIVLQRQGLVIVFLDPSADHIFVAGIWSSAVLATQEQTFDQFFIVYFQRQHTADAGSLFLEQIIQCNSLGRSSWKTIKYKAFGVWIIIQLGLYHADHNVIAYQLSTIHDLFGFSAKLRTAGDFGT